MMRVKTVAVVVLLNVEIGETDVSVNRKDFHERCRVECGLIDSGMIGVVCGLDRTMSALASGGIA